MRSTVYANEFWQRLPEAHILYGIIPNKKYDQPLI